MKIHQIKRTILAALLILGATTLFAQQKENQLSKAEKKKTVDSIGNKLKANYIFPEVANQMADRLNENFQSGAYKKIADSREFANQLTEDLQAVSKDKHIRVNFDPERIKESNQVYTAEDSLNFRNNYINRLKRNNFGFKTVEILEGNIGYLDLRSFSDTEFAGETATAAMNFLSNSDAIIIDLRFNGGGSPAMIQLITSYLFGSESVHLNNFYWRPSDRKSQTWTLPHVPGKRSPDTPVYVLTSGSTFSAAEEFSYNLKHLERATLIGETTGGGAHPGGPQFATDSFIVWVPTGRAINPITNSNWEGTGVKPHIEVKAVEALDRARLEALKDLKKTTEDKTLIPFYDWSIKGLKAKSNPVTLQTSTLKTFVGTYGPRVISFENGTLSYQRGSGFKYKLQPISDNEFMLEGLPDFRIQFVSENNKVVALQGLDANGPTDKHLKQ